MYEPTRDVLIEDAELSRIPRRVARANGRRVPGLFKFELPPDSVGLATRRATTTRPRSPRAVTRAGATTCVAKPRTGLDTKLGPRAWTARRFSFANWQKSWPRARLHERCLPRAGARRATAPRLRDRARAVQSAMPRRQHADVQRPHTILGSHRFSTVRMATHRRARPRARCRIGSTTQMLARGGEYAALIRHPGGGVR